MTQIETVKIICVWAVRNWFRHGGSAGWQVANVRALAACVITRHYRWTAWVRHNHYAVQQSFFLSKESVLNTHSWQAITGLRDMGSYKLCWKYVPGRKVGGLNFVFYKAFFLKYLFIAKHGFEILDVIRKYVSFKKSTYFSVRNMRCRSNDLFVSCYAVMQVQK